MLNCRPRTLVLTLVAALMAACVQTGEPAATLAPTAAAQQAAAEPTATTAAQGEVALPTPTPSPEASVSEADPATQVTPAQAPQSLAFDISLPPGFQIHYYATGVRGARSMALSPAGTLFVGTRDTGNVYAMLDSNLDYTADEVITLASGLNSPNGVALKNGSLYVAEINRILRFDDVESHLADPPEPVVVYDGYPTDTDHGWKYLRFGPDGYLYVPVGAPCNVCTRDDEIYATITRLALDGSDPEIYARGIRNTVGFDWHPETGELWFTDNGHDMLGDDLPPDELNHAPAPGLNFGFPYCHAGSIVDPEFGAGHSCDEFTPPAMPLGPHVAALGMRFYTGDMFPAEYRNQIFIAEHGSWARSQPIGYRISLVRLEGDQAVSYDVFADGWLQADGTVVGRPVDLLVLPDGSLLVSDNLGDAIYRITYTP